MTAYIYRWGDRKGQLCTLLARSSRKRLPSVDPGIPVTGLPAHKSLNSIWIEFEDGHNTITSANAIRKPA